MIFNDSFVSFLEIFAHFFFFLSEFSCDVFVCLYSRRLRSFKFLYHYKSVPSDPMHRFPFFSG